MNEEVHREIYSRCNPEKGDILYIKDGATCGISTINNLDVEFSLLSSVALKKPNKNVLNTYLNLFLQSAFCYRNVRESMKGVGITRIILKQMELWDIPLPPYAEQNRIVTAAEQLLQIAGGIERGQIELGPDVNVVGIELERFHTVILGGLGMGRGVVFQDDGLLAVDGTVQGVNLGGVALPADEIAYRVSRASMRSSNENYCNSATNSWMLLTSTMGKSMFLRTLKWASFVTMSSAFPQMAQSTNLLSSGSASMRWKNCASAVDIRGTQMSGGELFDGIGPKNTFVPEFVGFLLHLTGIIIGQDLLEFLHSGVGLAILQHFKNVKLAGSKNSSYCFHNTFSLCKNNYLT